MNRTIKQWASCDPMVMATKQSGAARFFAFADAKHDILLLHKQRAELLDALESLVGCHAMVENYDVKIYATKDQIAKAKAAIAAAKGE